ncbi:MAG: DUF222 domain-containing protein [Actinomycetales bacterium]|nr:DUF222 domain-containing protein [Actinomycetales bacterium]
MTITHLDPDTAGGMPSGAASGGASGGAGSGVVRKVAGVPTRLADRMLDLVFSRLADPEAGVVVTSADVQEVDRLARRVEAVRLALVAAADRQQVHRRCGHSSTSAWVASATRSGGAAAARDVALATALADGLDRTRVAFEAGEVSRSNAGIIARTMGKLPDTTTVVDRERVESALVRDARRLDPGRLDRAAKVALAAAEKSAAEVADHVEAQLVDEERRAYRLATVTMHDLGDGTTRLAATLPTPAAKMLGKVLQTMTAPRRDHLRKAAEAALADGQAPAGCLDDGSVAADLLSATGTHEHPSFGAGSQGTSGTGAHPTLGVGAQAAYGAQGRMAADGRALSGTTAMSPSGASGHRIEGRNADWADIDWAHRRGRALTELIEHLDTEKLTGKVASTVIITMTAEQVMGAAKAAKLQQTILDATGTLIDMAPSSGAATTDTGQLISASAARRIACNAGILPVVLGGLGHVLDVGRQERFFTEHQRTALATIYETCAAQDCDRPYAWSELHHEDPWSKGGLTDLDKAIPLCGFHHRKMHDPAYQQDITRNGPAHGPKTVHFRLRS